MRVTLATALFLVGCTPMSDSAEERHKHWRDAAVDSPAPRPDAPSADAPTSSPDASTTSAGVGPYFATPMFFNTDVSTTPKAANSDTLIATLKAEGGWGNGNVMQIDYAIDVLGADNSTPMRSFTTTSDFFTPDCDNVPMPVPTGGNVEGNTGYACQDNGDCHLIVYNRDTKDLFEMWRANITANGTFYGGCLAVWHGTKTYTTAGRGEQCTSADAAGFPIAPLLFTADEVAAGHIDHAIRFILPNDRTRKGFVPPATHGTSTTGGTSAPYYGVHLRLRADYPISSLPTEGARVVARAMQKYGMYHADGGNIALTAQSDRHTVHKWAGLLGSHDLSALKVEDFEVIDHGAPIALTSDCVRAP
jgi:serine/threonine-protein kinase